MSSTRSPVDCTQQHNHLLRIAHTHSDLGPHGRHSPTLGSGASRRILAPGGCPGEQSGVPDGTRETQRLWMAATHVRSGCGDRCPPTPCLPCCRLCPCYCRTLAADAQPSPAASHAAPSVSRRGYIHRGSSTASRTASPLPLAPEDGRVASSARPARRSSSPRSFGRSCSDRRAALHRGVAAG